MISNGLARRQATYLKTKVENIIHRRSKILGGILGDVDQGFENSIIIRIR